MQSSTGTHRKPDKIKHILPFENIKRLSRRQRQIARRSRGLSRPASGCQDLHGQVDSLQRYALDNLKLLKNRAEIYTKVVFQQIRRPLKKAALSPKTFV